MDNPLNPDELTSHLFPNAKENDIGVNHGNSYVSPDFRARPVEEWILPIR
jgi:hypothetical protein